MAKKKIKLDELKVKSFVTTLNKQEQKTAKGGIINNSGKLTSPDYWTAVKTQFKSVIDSTK